MTYTLLIRTSLKRYKDILLTTLLYMCNLPTCIYTDRLIFLKFNSLSYLRQYADIILGYTLMYGLVDVD